MDDRFENKSLLFHVIRYFSALHCFEIGKKKFILWVSDIIAFAYKSLYFISWYKKPHYSNGRSTAALCSYFCSIAKKKNLFSSCYSSPLKDNVCNSFDVYGNNSKNDDHYHSVVCFYCDILFLLPFFNFIILLFDNIGFPVSLPSQTISVNAFASKKKPTHRKKIEDDRFWIIVNTGAVEYIINSAIVNWICLA